MNSVRSNIEFVAKTQFLSCLKDSLRDGLERIMVGLIKASWYMDELERLKGQIR